MPGLFLFNIKLRFMNKVMLIGNVGKEPDVRYYERDLAVAALPLATTERGYTLQNGTQVPDRTEWHNLVFYRNLAKVVEKYVHKGDKIFVEGKIRTRTYNGPKGEKKYITEIYVDNMEMLTAKAARQQDEAVSNNASSAVVGNETGSEGSLPF